MFCRICIPGESGAWSCRQVQREERQEQGFRHRKPKSQADFSPSSLKSISRTFMTILTILWVCIHTDFLKAFAWNLVTNRQKNWFCMKVDPVILIGRAPIQTLLSFYEPCWNLSIIPIRPFCNPYWIGLDVSCYKKYYVKLFMIQGIFVLLNIALSCFWNSFELTRGLSETNWSLRPERSS